MTGAPGGAASAARWREITRLAGPALELPPGERAAYLDEACAADAGLRAEVERFLGSCDAARDYLAEPAAHVARPPATAPGDDAAAAAPALEGVRVGPYRVVREAGRGGMGAVYEAERDDDQYRQRVALKLARGDAWLGALGADDHLARRLVEERQILASLDHPHIARLLEGGVTTGGLPWFAMEYVEGVRVDRYCDERRLTVDERLALFCRVCDAVAYAHRHLVVHRDIKPSNILVTGEGAPKLLDFGIAKLLAPAPLGAADATGAAAEPATRTAFRACTPEYASPEQLRGGRVSTASDVYSLGVLLYELLAGHRPHRLSGRSPEEIERLVHTEAPALPSDAARLTPDGDSPRRVADARRTTPERLRRRLRGDLDVIVLAAMRREPERRYASADQLAADVRRALAGLPVSARRDTRAYRAAKFVRRHRAACAAAAAFALTLLGFSVVTAAQARQVARERDKARGASDFLASVLRTSDPLVGAGRETTMREALDSGVKRIDRELAGQPELRAELLMVMGSTYLNLGRLAEARRLLEASLALRAARAGDDDPGRSNTVQLLAEVLYELGDYEGAESRYREVLAERRRLFGPGARAVARTLNGLANALARQGREADAEPLVREALAIDRAERPPDPRVISQGLNNLGNILLARGDPGAAERLHREAYAMRRRLLGDAHAETANSLTNVAVALGAQGAHAAAESILVRSLASKRASLGAEHPDVAIDETHLARVRHRAGDLPAAEGAYRAAIASHRRGRPGGHPWTAVALHGLGEVLLARHDPAAAEPPLREALALQVRMLPRGHWRAAETMRALGRCLTDLGRLAEAEPLLVESAARLAAVWGTGDTRAAGARRDLEALHRARRLTGR